MKIDPYISPCIMLKFKWIKDLNIKPVILNLKEEKVRKNHELIVPEQNSIEPGSKIKNR